MAVSSVYRKERKGVIALCNLKIAKPKWLSKWLTKPTEQDAVIETLAKKVKDLEQSLSQVPIPKPEPPVVEVERYQVDTYASQSGVHLLFNIPKASLQFMVNYLNWAMDRREYYKEDSEASFDIEMVVSTEFVHTQYMASTMGTRRRQVRHFSGILRQLKCLKVVSHQEKIRGLMQDTDRLIYIHGKRKHRWTIEKLLKESGKQYRQNNVSKLHGWGT